MAVTISNPECLGHVEIGLICTLFYAASVPDSNHGRRRGTASATAHEAWLPVQSTAGQRGVRLAVPADAPFS